MWLTMVPIYVEGASKLYRSCFSPLFGYLPVIYFLGYQMVSYYCSMHSIKHGILDKLLPLLLSCLNVIVCAICLRHLGNERKQFVIG